MLPSFKYQRLQWPLGLLMQHVYLSLTEMTFMLICIYSLHKRLKTNVDNKCVCMLIFIIV